MYNCYEYICTVTIALEFIILHFFLSPHLTLSFSASTLTSLLSPIPQSSLIDTINIERRRDDISAWAMTSRSALRTESSCISLACVGFGGRMLFRGFRVWVDKRDVSLNSAYKKELKSVLSCENKNSKNLTTLPQVFIRGKHIRGAKTIKHLFETGELAKLLEGFLVQKLGFSFDCGNVQFALCMNCNGSRKVFDEEEDRVQRCLECSENDLIWCPDCSSWKMWKNLDLELHCWWWWLGGWVDGGGWVGVDWSKDEYFIWINMYNRQTDVSVL